MFARGPKIEVIYEDNHLIAVNKPSGYLVHGDGSGDPDLNEWVKAYIKQRYDKAGDVFLGVIHRIDRPVSGVVVFARTSKALERMNNLFKNREIDKTYWALSAELPPEESGKLVHWLTKDETKNKVRLYNHLPKKQAKDAKEAILTYKHLMTFAGLHLIEVHPETGRPHQIRAQLASIGCVIKGDKKYGAHRTNKDLSICLHCRSLSFVHPVKKKQVIIEADAPKGNGWEFFRDYEEEKNT